jgi:hypothetical protein
MSWCLQLRGPISVATYMKEALTNPMHGCVENTTLSLSLGYYFSC